MIDNDGLHIHQIVDSTPCGKHAADIGQGCWNISVGENAHLAICGSRVREAGFNGRISASSLSLHSQGSARNKQGYQGKSNRARKAYTN